MSAQTTYKFNTPMGAAGGIVDLAPYAIDTFINEENTGVMSFGLGVVQGTKAGEQIKLPVAASTAGLFEGITTNNRTTEYDLEGQIHIRKGAAMGVMRYGRIYAQVGEDDTPGYGDPVYLITSGNDAGKFVHVNTGSADYVAVKGKFMSGVDASTGVAQIWLYDQSQT